MMKYEEEIFSALLDGDIEELTEEGGPKPTFYFKATVMKNAETMQ